MVKLAFGGHLGVGFETTYGTSVARTAFARFLDAEVTRGHGEEYPETSRASGLEDAVLGDYDARLTALMEARPETIGAWLKAHAGTASVVTTTPSGGVNSRLHTIDHKDTRQPVSIERKLGNLGGSTDAELLAGGVVSKLGFELAGGLLVMRAEALGKKDSLVAATAATFDTKRPWMKHEGAVTLNGVSSKVRSVKVDLECDVVEDDYDVGSRYREDADVGARRAVIECEAAFRDLTLLKTSLGDAAGTGPVDDPKYNADKVVFTGPTIEGSLKHELTIDLPRVHWQAIGFPMRGKDVILQRLRGTALRDATAAYVWQAKLQNTQTAL